MRIKKLFGTALIASGFLCTQVILPAHAGDGDPPLDTVTGSLNSNEIFRLGLDADGFITVRVFRDTDDTTLTPRRVLPTGTRSTGGNSNVNPEQTYSQSALGLTQALAGNEGVTSITDAIAFIGGTNGGLSIQQGLVRAGELLVINDVLLTPAEARNAAIALLENIFGVVDPTEGEINEVIAAAQDGTLEGVDAPIPQTVIVIGGVEHTLDFSRPEKGSPNIAIADGVKHNLDSAPITNGIDFAGRPEGANKEISQSHHVKAGQGFSKGAKFTPSANKVTGNFHLAKSQARMPWALTLNTSYTGLDDNRDNADRDADIWSVTGSAAMKISVKTVLGASLTSKDGEVTSKALNSTLDAKHYGLTLYAAHQITSVLNASVFGGYTRGDNDIDLDGATGNFNSNAFNMGTQIQGRYIVGDNIRVNPDLTLGLAQTKNDTFLASNGVQTDASDTTSFTASLGGTFSKTYYSKQGTYSPSLGLHTVYEQSSGGDLQLINGSVLDNKLGFGVSVSPSINVTLLNGITLGFRSSYSQYDVDVSSWSVSGQLRIPF